MRLRRAFGFGNTDDFDPFLLLDDFRNERPATTTWPASRGIRTAASRPSPTCSPARSSTATAWATRASLGAGDVQWMTAGSGILHQEMPQGDPTGRMHGFQLWANLPVVAQDDRAALPGRHGARHPRGHRRRRHDGARDVRGVLGQDGAGRGRRGRPALPRRLGAAGRAEAPRRRDVAPRLRLRVRGIGHASATRRSRAPCCTEPPRTPRLVDAARATGEPLARAVRQRRRDRRAGGRRGHPLPARLRQAARGAGRVVRADRDEHARRSCGRPSRSCATARSSRRRDKPGFRLLASGFGLPVAGASSRWPRAEIREPQSSGRKPT